MGVHSGGRLPRLKPGEEFDQGVKIFPLAAWQAERALDLFRLSHPPPFFAFRHAATC